jgi:hypothetical protein
MVYAVGVFDRNHNRGRTRVEPQLERSLAGVRKQAGLEGLIDPRARDQPRPVRRAAGNQPVDPRAYLFDAEDSFLD